MKRNSFLFLFFIFSQGLGAQTVIQDFRRLHRIIAEGEVDNYLDKKHPSGLSGQFVSTLLPSESQDITNTCDEDEEEPNTRYEVILVAKGSSQITDMKNISPKYYFERYSGYEFMNEIIDDPRASIMSEKDFVNAIAEKANARFTTVEDKYNFLRDLSAELYDNFNKLREPGRNPGKDIPRGDMTVNQLFLAASQENEEKGGVCNDISEAIALIAEKMLPDQDVLILNTGTHVGLVITDGKEHRVINAYDQYQMTNQLDLEPSKPSTIVRIGKMEKGILKEIAVADTQLAQFVEDGFQTGRKLLKTSANIQDVYAHFEKVKTNSKRRTELGTSIGYGHLANSEALIVVAKYKLDGRRWGADIGTAASATMGNSTDFQLHLTSGIHRSAIHYVHPKVEIKVDSGVRADVMKGTSSLPGSPSVGYRVDLINQLDIKHENKHTGLLIQGQLQLQRSIGPGNWGSMTSAISDKEYKDKDMKQFISDLDLHINQVNASGLIQKKIDGNHTLFVSGDYQGTNIGQNFSALAGINIKAPHGAEILIFTGYDVKKNGFRSPSNITNHGEGVKAGIVLQTKGGVRAGVSVRNMAPGQVPIVEGQLQIPLDKRKNKNKD